MERIERYAREHQIEAGRVRILMLGDGSGNDSLHLVNRGFRVDYFDVPGSRTFEFAHKRFQYYSVLGDAVQLITDYERISPGGYDVVLSFEVLEHLTNPPASIRDMARFLKEGGIALVTEAFAGVTDALPTHLAANKQYSGRTPFLFLEAGLHLTWYSQPLFKPYEFTKLTGSAHSTRWRLLRDKFIMKAFLKARLHEIRA